MTEKSCKTKEPGFSATHTCDECPWRKDVPVGRFPTERFIQLRPTAEQGFNHIFACHKTVEGQDIACVGYLMVAGMDNWTIRLAAFHKRFDPRKLVATGPLYESFEEMAVANGVEEE